METIVERLDEFRKFYGNLGFTPLASLLGEAIKEIVRLTCYAAELKSEKESVELNLKIMASRNADRYNPHGD